MKRITATLLLLAMFANSAAAATCKYGHNCGPTPAAKQQSVRTAQRSKLVRQTPRRDAVAAERTIRYQPESAAAAEKKGCSACWLVGAALVGGGIAYLIAQSNDDEHVTNVTVVTPPKKKSHGDDDD